MTIVLYTLLFLAPSLILFSIGLSLVGSTWLGLWVVFVLFAIRAVIYFAVWILLARFYFNNSRAQDLTGDPQLTKKMRARSAPAIILFALTTTFAAFDWVMSLEPHWFSTIFGVYVFAGANLSFFGTITLVTLFMQERGRLTDVVSKEMYTFFGRASTALCAIAANDPPLASSSAMSSSKRTWTRSGCSRAQASSPWPKSRMPSCTSRDTPRTSLSTFCIMDAWECSKPSKASRRSMCASTWRIPMGPNRSAHASIRAGPSALDR